MPDDPSEMKAKFLCETAGVEAEAKRVKAELQALLHEVQYAHDVARASNQYVAHIPPGNLSPSYLDRATERWQGLRGTLVTTLVNSIPTSINIEAMSATSGTLAMLSVTSVSFGPESPQLQEAKTRLQQALNRPLLINKVRESLRRLGLDACSSEGLPPLALFDNAVSAFERPVSGDGSPWGVCSLMRQAIQKTIDDLVLRRPKQENMPPVPDTWFARVTSIGRQCARPDLRDGLIQSLAADVHPLLSDLSKTKDADMSREDQSDLFDRGLVLLHPLLKSLDESQLRPVQKPRPKGA